MYPTEMVSLELELITAAISLSSHPKFMILQASWKTVNIHKALLLDYKLAASFYYLCIKKYFFKKVNISRATNYQITK